MGSSCENGTRIQCWRYASLIPQYLVSSCSCYKPRHDCISSYCCSFAQGNWLSRYVYLYAYSVDVLNIGHCHPISWMHSQQLDLSIWLPVWELYSDTTPIHQTYHYHAKYRVSCSIRESSSMLIILIGYPYIYFMILLRQYKHGSFFFLQQCLCKWWK